MGATELLVLRPSLLVPERRGFASAEATKGLSDRPLETFGAVAPMFLDFFRG